jgi:hypothetical protein
MVPTKPNDPAGRPSPGIVPRDVNDPNLADLEGLVLARPARPPHPRTRTSAHDETGGAH